MEFTLGLIIFISGLIYTYWSYIVMKKRKEKSISYRVSLVYDFILPIILIVIGLIMVLKYV